MESTAANTCDRGGLEEMGRNENLNQISDYAVRLKGFFRAAPVGCGLVRNRIILDVNDRFCEMVGYSAAELLGRDASMVYPTRDEYEYVGREKYTQIRDKGTGTVQTRFKRKDGEIIDVILSSTALDPADLPKGFVFTVVDISERKKIEEDLRKSERQYRSTIDSMDEVLHVVDRDLRIVMANKTCERWVTEFGFHTEIAGRPIFELFPFLPERIRDEYKQVFETGETLVTEEVTELAGREIISDTRKIPVMEGSEVVRIITIIRDVTERRAKERQIEHYRDRLKRMAVELMTAEERERRRISVGLHDGVGQKLALAKLNLQAANRRLAKGSDVGSLDAILASLDEAIREIRSLTFELASPVLYEIGLAAAVQQYLREEIERTAGIKCTIAADKSLKEIDAEISVALFRVIRELLMNVVRHARAKTLQVGLRRQDDSIVINVTDDGIGFDASRYLTSSRDDKTHFGLFSVQERLEQMGGRLKIRSSADWGTSVTVTAPMKKL